MSPGPPSARAYTIEGLKTIVSILQDISNDLPAPASTIINLVQHIITTVEEVQNNRDECELLRNRLLEILPVVMASIQNESKAVDGKLTMPPELKPNVERFLKNLENIEKELAKIVKVANSKRKRHQLTAIFWVKSHASTLQKCRDDLDWAMKLFDVSSHLSDSVRLWDMAKKINTVLSNQNMVSRKTQTVITNQFLEALPRAKYASFDCERPDKPSTCFEGTRTAILKLITDWITDPDPTQPRFFWLNGIAGIGKTTVACTVANLMQDLGLLGGQFCFSRRGEAELRKPALVFPTIAYQLARFDPEFGRRITAALEADPEAPYASLKQQLDRLIINPLTGLERDPKRVVVLVLDAFDECEVRGAKEILQLLIAALPSLPFFLKIFVTSRPEHHIRSILVPATNLRITALHDIEASVVKSDILLYLRHRLRNLGEERGIDLPPDWVKESDIELLADKAGNFFIHAATSVRFLLQGWDPFEQLELLLKIVNTPRHHATTTAKPFADLDQLYEQILLGLFTSTDDREVAARLRLVLGSVVLLRDPLPVDSLERLLGTGPGRAASTLRYLHSVILTPPPPDDCPRVYHPSFPDFLQDHTRCTNDQIWINTDEHEGRMALRCLKLMNSKLHKGMLGDLGPTLLNSEVEDLDAKLKEAFPPELQYACRYWASHLANTLSSNAEVRAELEIFAARTLLPWIEAMSWLGDTGLAIKALETANSWQTTSSVSSEATGLLNDAYRLFLAHMSTITLSAQNVATSVLPFVPRATALASRYRDYADASIKVLRGVDAEWPACLMVWGDQSEWVTSVALSPDGSRAASASHNETIVLWDATTGSRTTMLEGHSDWVNEVAFSPDGSSLASASRDCSVRVWDTTTGTCVSTFEGHSREVLSVAWSPDGSRLASGSRDRTVRFWSVTSEWCIATPQDHLAAVMSVAFSPNESSLASGSADKTIRIWDMDGSCTAILEGHASPVLSLSFSPDGSQLASGSSDNSIRIWNLESSGSVSILQGHAKAVSAVTFSPNGTRLASASHDETLRVWDVATGGCISTFRGHSHFATSVAFTPNGSRLVSGSRDGTIRLWDAAVVQNNVAVDDHTDYVICLGFSLDGLRLASASWDRTARIWDATDGSCLMKLEGHSNKVNCVTFHPDGLHVATGSSDRTIRIWNTTTGDCTATLEGHSGMVMTLTFSADGTRLQSQDHDNNVHLWNVATGAQLEDFNYLEHPEWTPFHVDNARLFKTDEEGWENLVCILPPGTNAGGIASSRLDGGGDRVALGCENGDLYLLEISSPSS